MADTDPPAESVDVLVVGGGPVGLITAYQLALHLPSISQRIKIIEKTPKSIQDTHGRAITLFPRSTELLDQLGLADALAQECFACRDTVNYDKDGNETEGRGWSFMRDMKDTKWDFALVLRQKYQEKVFRTALRKHNIEVEVPVALIDIQILQNVDLGGHRVLATVENADTGTKSLLKCRYLVGADGGKSFVRRALSISFDGTSSEDKWVRIDGLITTNLPKPRTYCAIESPTHGNVLWAALDHGATRIGFAFTAARQAAYTVFDEAAAIKEAIASVKPFSLVFQRVDWWTIYTVGQRIARSFFTHDCIFLAGDACHTHSSGAAQGLNTGIHDAVNLGWKLALVVQGLAIPDLLNTYEAERRPNVEKLITYDKDIARLMTMQLPEHWTGDPNADPNVVLGEVMKKAAGFSTGLGIYYSPDSFLNIEQDHMGVSSVKAGQRAPDGYIQKPATFEPTRLYTQTPNIAHFYILVFAGDVAVTKLAFAAFTSAMGRLAWLDEAGVPVSKMTIFAGHGGPSVHEMVDGVPFGRVFFDERVAAHERYGINVNKGAVFVLRPDGWVGTVIALDEQAAAKVSWYFGRFLITEGMEAHVKAQNSVAKL
ncbi:FAD/NAD(P)-binding domain-containing protein [Plenodomus tracheiphilus IPT5]|uniref:FAD/NAD(P)-binding domain-containing protein n=1 Tax=Plenodomus tracheiphilus IPT5 TaxID=1408161 RepID=A0A6A7BJ69_9PLEO|nr:FAD/NAD(P)-binding domain-containing protein [Plenodomus tracheiphilus IPT5]